MNENFGGTTQNNLSNVTANILPSDGCHSGDGAGLAVVTLALFALIYLYRLYKRNGLQAKNASEPHRNNPPAMSEYVLLIMLVYLMIGTFGAIVGYLSCGNIAAYCFLTIGAMLFFIHLAIHKLKYMLKKK